MKNIYSIYNSILCNFFTVLCSNNVSYSFESFRYNDEFLAYYIHGGNDDFQISISISHNDILLMFDNLLKDYDPDYLPCLDDYYRYTFEDLNYNVMPILHKILEFIDYIYPDLEINLICFHDFLSEELDVLSFGVALNFLDCH